MTNDIISSATEQTKKIVMPYALSHFDDKYLVNEAIKYSLSNCGKLLRPTFVLETAKILNTKLDDNLIRIAASIEMIHTYSLIHDDLPCMDDDDMRRNMPSCHIVFGEGIATLAGDGLLNMAFEVLLNGKITDGYIKAIRFIAKCCGVSGMIGGQSDDIKISPDVSIDTLTSIVNNKTCRLISAAILSSAIYCNATEKQLQQLSVFANYFGVAFQLRDDLNDIASGEISLASKLGESNSEALISDCIIKATDAIADFTNSQFFIAVLDTITKK